MKGFVCAYQRRPSHNENKQSTARPPKKNLGADDENNITPRLTTGIVRRDKWHVATIGRDAIIKLQFWFYALAVF